ncbi:RluA family pseudouridine synthase [Candidatus Peregrinibacteria bacterium]|nr:RluA family pseudouridine synthase [Candidatus Peregrinibacteria bacterium]
MLKSSHAIRNHKEKNTLTLKVNEFLNQKRIDQWISAKLEELSRSYVQKEIKEGRITVNEKPVKPHYLLQFGDIIKIEKNTSQDKSKFKKVDVPIKIVHEEKDFLIINKSDDIAVHPAKSLDPKEPTIIDAIYNHLSDELKTSKSERPGIVHRLDKGTSGLLIIAKNKKTQDYFLNQFKNRKIKKIYVALIKDNLKPEEGSIEAPLTRSKKNRKKITVSLSEKARYALSHYKILEYFKNSSFAEVKIVTGRTHQIRVHLSAIHHPIIGDETYGDKKTNEYFKKKWGLTRPFLHAYKLTFTHPKTGKKQTVIAPIETKLIKILEALRKF